jgi:hypothetical protein
MPTKFPKVQDGDELQPWMLNILYREAERWRKLKGSGLVNVAGVDSDSPPTIALQTLDPGIPANSGSGFAAGSPGSPSSATVTLYTHTGSGAALDTSRNFQVTAYSTFGTAIGANKTIWLTQMNDFYYVYQVDC